MRRSSCKRRCNKSKMKRNSKWNNKRNNKRNRSIPRASKNLGKTCKRLMYHRRPTTLQTLRTNRQWIFRLRKTKRVARHYQRRRSHRPYLSGIEQQVAVVTNSMQHVIKFLPKHTHTRHHKFPQTSTRPQFLQKSLGIADSHNAMLLANLRVRNQGS